MLMMFPYPSAEGLHVGTCSPSRQRHLWTIPAAPGHTVFEPFGYDAFGIHSENYALR